MQGPPLFCDAPDGVGTATTGSRNGTKTGRVMSPPARFLRRNVVVVSVCIMPDAVVFCDGDSSHGRAQNARPQRAAPLAVLRPPADGCL